MYVHYNTFLGLLACEPVCAVLLCPQFLVYILHVLLAIDIDLLGTTTN